MAKSLSEQGHKVYGTHRKDVDPLPGVMYITDTKLVPIQNIMRSIIISATGQLEDMGLMIDDVRQQPNAHTLKCAAVVVSTLPILCVYPFIQKYFVKGVMVGSVKG